MVPDLSLANQWNKPKAELSLEIRGQIIINRQKSASDRISI